jgi:NAD(P)-dependent dehydrogenase (short-subunit alcohol dehydrogenase family)
LSQSENDSLRFDGHVAIVTGAGGQRSLGRAYARLLAERGAKVVVNDLGVGPNGRGGEQARAEIVAQEITDTGGEAVADRHSVAERDLAHAVIQTALDAWGRVDIVVNNAGVSFPSRFDETTDADLQLVIGTHLMGTVWMCRAAWPHMKAQGYGRIVNIASGGMHGLLNVAFYGAAKAGVHGLTRALAVDGLEHGIQVNCILPRAYTAAVEISMEDTEYRRSLMGGGPEQVAPTVAYLAHESCSLTGKAINSGRGKISECFASNTAGYDDDQPTPESIRDHLDQILDRTGAIPIPEADWPGRRGIEPLPYDGGTSSVPVQSGNG